jgi:dihydroorotate dehydrogenase (fumarate)
MSRLRSRYLGLDLPSPLIASAGPLTGKLDTLRQLEDAGASAVVLPSVFEEQLEREEAFKEHFLHANTDALTEAQSFYPDPGLYEADTDHALKHLQDAKAALGIPVIASLNGATTHGWRTFANRMREAGADAIELNLYEVAADPAHTSADIEDRQVEIVRDVVEAVDIPVAVKIGPHYTALANLARRFEDAGAAALVLFNRFYQPDLQIEDRTLARTLGLSQPRDHRLPLSWIAILRGQRTLDLAATSGIHAPEDAVKALMAGANAVCSTSALLKHGPEHLATLGDGLLAWMDDHGYGTVDELRGCMRRDHTEHPELFERANYIQLLHGGEWD